MAVLRFGKGPFSLIGGGGTRVFVSSNVITLDEFGGSGIQHYYGSGFSGVFQWTGTVTSMDYRKGTNSYSLTGLNHSASQIAGYVVDGNFALLAAYLLNGNDQVIGTARADSLSGFGGRDRITGSTGNDFLFGGVGSDVLEGGTGNDYLEGGLEKDTVIGGTGNDTYYFDLSDGRDLLIEKNGEGIDTVRSTLNHTLGTHFENLILTASATRGIGNALDNNISSQTDGAELQGRGGNDTLTGFGDGVDILIGGTGNDTYRFVFGGPDDVMIENEGEGTDTVVSDFSFTLGENFENLILGKGADINGAGNGASNIIIGNNGNNHLDGAGGDDELKGGKGNDTLVGGAGADTLDGGEGDDHYIYDEDDVVLDSAGIDSVLVETNDSVVNAPIERLLLSEFVANVTGGAADNIIEGNTLDNILSGGDGNDTLHGGGVDTLIGGSGDDVFIDDGDCVCVEEAGGGNDTITTDGGAVLDHFENVILLGSQNLDLLGGEQGNLLFGNSGSNLIEGNGGNDTLYGGTGGIDTLIGGEGDDTYRAGIHPSTTIVELADGGRDTLYLLSGALDGVTLPDELENVIVAGDLLIDVFGNEADNHMSRSNAGQLFGLAGHDTLVGGNGQQTLVGGDGDDVLNGGAGTDSLVGGAGDDSFRVNFADSDFILEGEDGGIDTVHITFDNFTQDYTLGENIERAVLEGTGGSIDGNSLDNHIALAGAGPSSIRSGSGNDTLVGNGGIGNLSGGDGNDVLIGGRGDEWLDGDAGRDQLSGGAGKDMLIWDANDTINGGAGVDTLMINGTKVDLTTTANSNDKLLNIEEIYLRASFGITLKLSASDVIDMSPTNQIRIFATENNKVDIVGAFTEGATSKGFTLYTLSGGAKLLIESEAVVV